MSARASSPAFVSRVSPTVSSEPMLSSSAVSSGSVGRHRQRNGAAMASWALGGRASHRWYHRGPDVGPGSGAAPIRPSGAIPGRPHPTPPDPCPPRPRPARPDRADPRRGLRPRHGARRAGQGRGRGDRRRDREGRGASSGSRSVVVFAVILLRIGTLLFLAEWLLGSMGWGVLHGSCCSSRSRSPAPRRGRRLAAGGSVGRPRRDRRRGPRSSALALALPNRRTPRSAMPPCPASSLGSGRLVGVIVGLIGLIVGLIALRSRSWRIGRRHRRAVLGVVLGGVTAVDLGRRSASGSGSRSATWRGSRRWSPTSLAPGRRRGPAGRFTPTQTIETSKETLEWLQSKMPPGIGS